MSSWKWLKELVGSKNSALTITDPKIMKEDKSIELPLSTLIVRPDSVPPDIRSLLWFYDGAFKNYTSQENHYSKNKVGDFDLKISFVGSKEPSAIKMCAPIMQPPNVGDVPWPTYYPSYMQLEPDQRWIYLNWLKNVDDDINIGYVFIFYYGLERHLYFGNYELAFQMILRLRTKHKNSSFQGYSANALIAASLLHQREDLFVDYLESIDIINEAHMSSFYLISKRALGLGLSPQEIMAFARTVGFSNRRYLKEEKTLFEIEVRKLLLEDFGSETLGLEGFLLSECPQKFEFIAANYSIDQKQRGMDVPNLVYHPELRKILNGILMTAHENTKIMMKEMKKKGTYVAAFEVSKAFPIEPDPLFSKNLFFSAIDVHVFEVNEKYYVSSICPTCKEEMGKRPVHKGKCPHCSSLVLAKNSVFNGLWVLLTEEEYANMTGIRNERSRRSWIKKEILNTGMRESAFLAFMKHEKLSLEDALLFQADVVSSEYRGNEDYGLYRNALLHKGNIYERIGNTEEALKLYLAVSHLDINGCMNSGIGFIAKQAFLAPAVINWIIGLADKLGYERNQVRKLYLEIAEKCNEKEMSLTPEKAWEKLGKALYQDL